ETVIAEPPVVDLRDGPVDLTVTEGPDHEPAEQAPQASSSPRAVGRP
ncbi:MAG: hypothetical protein JWM47_1722, partial [Acidimicrobiales bacterium]|nr:hypothetical protein [Acidimicrobiales bacterium]